MRQREESDKVMGKRSNGSEKTLTFVQQYMMHSGFSQQMSRVAPYFSRAYYLYWNYKTRNPENPLQLSTNTELVKFRSLKKAVSILSRSDIVIVFSVTSLIRILPILFFLRKPTLVYRFMGADINVVTEIDYGLRRSKLKNLIFRSLIKRVDYFSCLCPQVKKTARNDLKIPEEKLFIQPNGFDLDSQFRRPSDDELDNLRNKYQLEKNRPVVLSVAKVNRPVKNVEGFVEVLRHFSDTPVTVWFVGSGIENPTMNALIKSLPRSVECRFFGSVPRSDMKAFYTLADVLVHTAYVESFFNPAIEALSCGLPLVLTERVGVVDYLSSKPFVRKVKMNPEDVAIAAKDLLFMENSLQMRDAAAAYAREFAFEKTLDSWMQMFEEIESRK